VRSKLSRNEPATFQFFQNANRLLWRVSERPRYVGDVVAVLHDRDHHERVPDAEHRVACGPVVYQNAIAADQAHRGEWGIVCLR
jgi:hypothetical protein